MSTTVSAERFSKVKWSLESWREVVLLTDKLLSWQQDWYAGVVAGLVILSFSQISSCDLINMGLNFDLNCDGIGF